MHPVQQIALGILVADFAAAFFHFFEDNYLPYTDAPGTLGEIARDNELHHALPYSMTTPPITTNVRVSVVIALLVAAGLVILAPGFAATHKTMLAAMVIAGTLSNLVHRWQHERDCTRPKVITALQNAGVLVGRSQHKEHHQDPERRYGVLLGFTNYIYDGLHIWDILRWLIPFELFPKPGVDAYRGVVPRHIQEELEETCPRKLEEDEVECVKDLLGRAFVESVPTS